MNRITALTLTAHPEIARDLAAKLSDWTGRLVPPGNPDRVLNGPEGSGYAHYFDLTD